MRFYTWTLALVSAPAQRDSPLCSVIDPASVDLSWHPPNLTSYNDLAAVVNGSGVGNMIFNSSTTPATVPYSTYNWCNMPHVRPREYVKAPEEFKLEYVEVIHRHHKRTPYAANMFPRETYSWSCDDEALFYYGVPLSDGVAAQVNWHVYLPDANLFAPQGFDGTCQFPQITGQGLNDSRQHGQDLFAVYHGIVRFLPETYDASKASFRVTNNVITSQVAGQVVAGMYQMLRDQPFRVLLQPNSVDSLEPKYPCSSAIRLYTSYGDGSRNPGWMAHLNSSMSLFAQLDAISGVNTSDPDWHNSYDHYYDNLSARLCHNKPLPCSFHNNSLCITQAVADSVFRLGQYEYSFIYRDSAHSLKASTASFGVWIAELSSNIRAAMNRSSDIVYRHNIAHDGSVSRLLSILQVDVMVWPGMGAEVVFELYSKQDCWFVRVLWSGQVLTSSNPTLGLLDLIPIEIMLTYFDGLVGKGARKVPDLCRSSS